MVKAKTFKEKEKQKSEYVRRFRNAMYFEMQHDYQNAMIAWALAEIASPTKKEKERATARKKACLEKENQSIERLLDEETKSLLKRTIKVKVE